MLKKSKAVCNAFNKDGHLGIFRLFLSSSFTNTVLEWTNIDLHKQYKTEISVEQFNSYLG